MFHFAPQGTLNTSTSSLPPTSLVLLSSSSPNADLLSTHPLIDCDDPRRDGTSTEFHSSTGYEPKRTELNWILLQNQIIDDQDDIEEIGVKPLSYSQSLIHSAYDSAEALRRRPTRTSKTNNYVRCWLHHCIIRNDKNEGQIRAYHSERESLMINSSRNPEVSGKLDAECTGTNTSSSLKTRKLDDKFFSRS